VFEPFQALRYADPALDRLIAPPYDVLSETDLSELSARSPHNIVHVDVPRGGPDRYALAAARLAQWRRDGVLVQDARPSFTIYRMTFGDHTGRSRKVSGVLGGLEVVDAGLRRVGLRRRTASGVGGQSGHRGRGAPGNHRSGRLAASPRRRA